MVGRIEQANALAVVMNLVEQAYLKHVGETGYFGKMTVEVTWEAGRPKFIKVSDQANIKVVDSDADGV